MLLAFGKADRVVSWAPMRIPYSEDIEAALATMESGQVKHGFSLLDKPEG